MIEYLLGFALLTAIGFGLRLYLRLESIKNARIESQDAYENLLFSIEREREGIETTMNRMQINIEYLQEENRAKVSEISELTNEIEEITTQSEEKSVEIKKSTTFQFLLIKILI